MSSDADAAAAETVALFNTFSTGNYCVVAASVLFIYDAFITFDRELVCFWTAKRTGAALLYFVNKWTSMMYFVMLLVDFASFPSDKRASYDPQYWGFTVSIYSCSLFEIARYAVGLTQFVPAAGAFSALRAYVLSRSKLLGIIIFAMSLVPVGANLVLYAYQFSGQNFPPFGCLETNTTSPTIILRFGTFNIVTCIVTDPVQGVVVVISRVPLIVADTMLIYITWTKLRCWATLTDIQQSKRLRLSDILFRSGTIYFVILFVLNGLHLVLSATAVAGNGSQRQSLITQFTSPLTAILISRFLLALQEADRTVVRLDSNDPLHSSRDYCDSAPSFISSLGGFANAALSACTNDDDGQDMELQAPSLTEEGRTVQGTASPLSAMV